MQQSPLLALPAELRIRIYQLVILDGLHHFPEPVSRPPLLDVSRQLKREYSDIFYGSDCIKLAAYYSDTDSSAEIQARAAKQSFLRQSTFADLSDSHSLASARRHCQTVYYDGKNAQQGILTVQTDVGFRRWQYTPGGC
ncbi:hypothetical protein LTR53_012155 [Teratosphaeriaceae sp. CCFEE 6253]|nr:hypothetical protein LTR53_012155 [Teratosphaeriaceae sp. CCFEE 6253]